MLKLVTLYDFLKILLDPLIAGLILIAGGFFLSLKNSKKKFWRTSLISSFFIFYLAGISPVSNGLCYFLEKEYLRITTNKPDKLDVVVVLGGGVTENKYLKETIPSHETASRLLYAVQIFRTYGTDYLVCSGKGKGRLTEAEVMGNNAKRLGIPVEKIKLDLKSKNTKEHAEELNKMVNNKNLRIGLVTSAYHMQRSEREFRKYFRNVVTLPSNYLYASSPLSIYTFIPTSSNIYKFSIAFHEIIGILWYKIAYANSLP